MRLINNDKLRGPPPVSIRLRPQICCFFNGTKKRICPLTQELAANYVATTRRSSVYDNNYRLAPPTLSIWLGIEIRPFSGDIAFSIADDNFPFGYGVGGSARLQTISARQHDFGRVFNGNCDGVSFSIAAERFFRSVRARSTLGERSSQTVP